MSKRTQKPKSDLNLAAEEPGLATRPPEGTDPKTLPFSEFSDQDINSEKWDNSVSTKDKEVPNQLFEDPHEIHLPSGIYAHQWKRCSEIYQNVNFVVFTPSPEYPDLITPNQHLLNNEFYRKFISSIETLLYIGCTKPFPLEYENPGCVAAAGNAPWRPWDHIYSNCKITKGEHTSMFNPAGKYIVRLYWLGTWRKIFVDDLVPIDVSEKILIPTLQVPKERPQTSTTDFGLDKPAKGKAKADISAKKEIIQIWPIILCKALLKVASLYLNEESQFSDFDIINCLTGWVPQKIKIADVSSNDLWDILMAHVERFEWDDYKEGSAKKSGSTKPKLKEKEVAETAKKSAKGTIPTGIENVREGNRFVVLSCSNFKALNKENVPEDQNTTMFLSQVRDIPLVYLPPRPELEFWKTFRYEKWAVEQGIISPDIKKLNIKSLKIVDPFKRLLLMKPECHQEELINFQPLDLDNAEKKSEKSSKSSKKSGKNGKTFLLEPDPSMWIDLKDIEKTVSYMTVYFQTRIFKTKTLISDIDYAVKPTGYNQVIYPFILKETRNEPVYLFMDSIDYKFLVINLAQTGNTSILQKDNKEKEPEPEFKAADLDLCDEIVLSKTKREAASSASKLNNGKHSVFGPDLQPISVVLEEYCWESNTVNKPKQMISTCGIKSLIIDLKPGRVSFRLWLVSNCSYVMQIFSDTKFTAGCLEEYISECSKESQLLTNLCYELGSCFGKLVQSFGLPDYSVSLRNFYHCYKPFEYLSKRELVIIHRVFFEEFCKIIEEGAGTSAVLDCVKLLFLQLKTFDYINPYVEEPHLYAGKFPLEEQIEYAKLMQRSAVKIQAFFKRIYIKALMKKMCEDHKQYISIFDTLKKIYIDLLSSNKSLNYLPILLRRFFERPEMQFLSSKFEIFQDIQSVLNILVYTGSIIAQESCWIPICRYVFYINSDEPVTVKINVFCNLITYAVRVFDNDNLREIKQINRDVIVERYSKNKQGFTVLAYGWSYSALKVNWKLILTTKKMSRDDLIIVPTSSITTLCLCENYIPNFENIISRHVIKCGADAMLTANLTTSYDQVEFSLKLFDEDGKRLYEARGVKSVLLPLMHLKWNESFQVMKKRASDLSLIKDISYNKLSKKDTLTDMVNSQANVADKTNSVDAVESDLGNTDSKSVEEDDRTTISSQRNENDSSTKLVRGKNQSKSGSRSLLSKTGSIQRPSTSSLNKIAESVCTEYILQAEVIGNSWPLTANEWDFVQKLREKSYLNLLDERKSSVKRTSHSKKRSSAPISGPIWKLDLVYPADSPLEFELDHSKSDERKAIKSKWFSDIERYRKGAELRQAFVQQNLVEKTEKILDRNMRSNNARDFATEVIIEKNLEQYMIKPLNEIDEDYCQTKTEDDYIIEEANIERKIHKYEKDLYAIQEEIEGKLQEQKENFEILNHWFENIRNESLDLLNEAEALQKERFKKALQSSIKGSGDKKEKSKKDKK